MKNRFKGFLVLCCAGVLFFGPVVLGIFAVLSCPIGVCSPIWWAWLLGAFPFVVSFFLFRKGVVIAQTLDEGCDAYGIKKDGDIGF